MEAKFFDTHFHLDEEDDIQKLVDEAADNGVDWMLSAGAAVGGTSDMLDRIKSFNNVFAAVGVHPHEAEQFDDDIDRYRQWTKQEQVRSVGEIGLDYYYDNSPRERQQKVFRQFLELAVETSLPAIVHIRDAYEDADEILRDVLKGTHPFVVHCFSGTPDWARRFLDQGAMISFTGLVTFKKAENVREALRVVPLDRVMFETDSPYLAPVPHRGRRNQPAYVRHVIERAATEFGVSVDELARVSTANAFRFFRIS